MSDQREKESLERTMDDAPDGQQIDLQDVAKAVNSGQVEAEEQPTPEDELRPANAYARERADPERPS
jgi:hypothetical protein